MRWDVSVYGLASFGMLLYAVGAGWDAVAARFPAALPALRWRRRLRFRDRTDSRRFALRAAGFSGLWLGCAVVLAIMAVDRAVETRLPRAGVYVAFFLAGLAWFCGCLAWSLRRGGQARPENERLAGSRRDAGMSSGGSRREK